MADQQGGPVPGNRRIDRLLAPDYLAELPALPLAEVRARRAEAEQEEADLSYLRRLLQGRIDILRAETRRRAGGGGSLVEQLPSILADERPGAPRGLGRHSTAQPSRADAHRRHVETLVADVTFSDVAALSEERLREVLAVFEAEERVVSEGRRAVQQVMDACAAEIARRYREGEADVSRLLTEG